MEKVMTLPVFRDEKTGEQWIQAVFEFPKCGCKIIGGGTCTQPLRIEFCNKHKKEGRGKKLGLEEGWKPHPRSFR